MRADPAFLAVADGAHPDVEPFEGAEPAFDVGQSLVGAHRVFGGEPRGGLAGAKHVDAVEARLGVDACVVALIDQTPVVDRPPEVLGHLVPGDDPSHLVSELCRIERRAGAPGGLARDAFEPCLGGGEQRLALARPLLGQQRVVARDQALAGIVGAGELGQVLHVEQRQLQRLGLDQGAHLHRPQRADPSEPRMALEVVDLDLCEQAPVADQHHPLESEVLAQLHDLVRDGVGVGGVARIGLDRYRASAWSAQDGIDDLGLGALAVAVVAKAHQRAGAPLVIAPAHVGEHRGAFVQVALGEPALDALLAREQPVHRLVEGVLVGVAQVELLGQRGGVPSPGGGELRGGVEQPLHDHGQDPVALGRAFGGDEPVQAQAPGHGEQGVDVAVGEGAFDGEGVFGADEALALEDSAQGVDFLCGPVGEVGQCAFADSAAFAPAFSQEDGGAGVAVGDGFDVHGNDNILYSRSRQAIDLQLHGNMNHP